MKQYVKSILNEARVQRTIDPKIWASMSSMSSKNRATLAADAKPMKRDTEEILLQKYVAGLLTMKVPCPATESDIKANKAYQNFGEAYLNAGGSLAKIQKLYVENGGTFDGEIASDEPVEQDYPSYDEVDNDEQINSQENDYPSYDDVEEPTDIKNDQEYPDYDDVDRSEEKPQHTSSFDNTVANIQTKKEYPDYDDVDTDNMEDNNVETFADKYADNNSLKNYFKSIGYKLKGTLAGDYLVWDNNDGLKISKDNKNAIAQCVVSCSKLADKKPRFMFFNTTSSTLGNAGNNGVYDSYYFKRTTGERGRLAVTAGTTYYYQEDFNGSFYTNILADNDNKAAIAVKDLASVNNINGLSNDQKNSFENILKDKVYLPTLPELTAAIKYLNNGRYWTSSVADNGNANIMLSVNPDKIARVTDTNVEGIVVGFISF